MDKVCRQHRHRRRSQLQGRHLRDVSALIRYKWPQIDPQSCHEVKVNLIRTRILTAPGGEGGIRIFGVFNWDLSQKFRAVYAFPETRIMSRAPSIKLIYIEDMASSGR